MWMLVLTISSKLIYPSLELQSRCCCSSDLTTRSLYYRWQPAIGTTLELLSHCRPPQSASFPRVITSKGWRGFPEVTSPFPSPPHLCHSWQMLILGFLGPSVLETLPPPQAASVLQCITVLITRRFKPESFLLQFKPITSCPICKRRGELLISFLFAAVLHIFEDCFVDTDASLHQKHSLRRCLSPHHWNYHTFGYNVHWWHFYCKLTLQNELKTEMKPHWKAHIMGIYIPFLLSLKIQIRLFLSYA